MSEARKRIEDLASQFVAQLIEIARHEMMEMLGGGGGGVTSPTHKPSRSRARGGKRTASDLDAVQDKLLAFIKKNPGLRIEQINKELGTNTKQLQLPIRKLLAAKAIKATGRRRSTKYTAGKKN